MLFHFPNDDVPDFAVLLNTGYLMLHFLNPGRYIRRRPSVAGQDLNLVADFDQLEASYQLHQRPRTKCPAGVN